MADSDVSGQVTDEGGNPIDNTKIYLWREDLTSSPQVIAETTTDSSGNYEFDIHPEGTGGAEAWHVAGKKDGAEQYHFESKWGISASVPGQGGISEIGFSTTGDDEPAFTQLGFVTGGTAISGKQTIGFGN